MKLPLKDWLSAIDPLKKWYNRSLLCDLTKLVFDDKNKIIMDWSCKCGCSIAVGMMFKHLGLLDEVMKKNKRIHAYRRLTYTPHHRVNRTTLCNKDNYLFKVVRNPYTRAVSSYLHVCGRPKLNLLAQKNPDSYKTLSFRQFIILLEGMNVKHDIDPHCRVQTKNYERRNLRQPVICKLESFAQDIEKINTECNVNFSLEGVTAHHHAKKDVEKKTLCVDHSFENFDGAYPNYNYFYDQVVFEKVTQLYKEDIERYEYDFPWEEIT